MPRINPQLLRLIHTLIKFIKGVQDQLQNLWTKQIK
jgi:hypothetical protein